MGDELGATIPPRVDARVHQAPPDPTSRLPHEGLLRPTGRMSRGEE